MKKALKKVGSFGKHTGWIFATILSALTIAGAWYGWLQPYKKTAYEKLIDHFEIPQQVRSAFIGEMRVSLRQICAIPELPDDRFPRPLIQQLGWLDLETPVFDTMLSDIKLLEPHEQELLLQTGLTARRARNLKLVLEEPGTPEEEKQVRDEIRKVFFQYRKNLRDTLSIMETLQELNGKFLEIYKEDSDFQQPDYSLNVPALTKQCREDPNGEPQKATS